jgi:hypothetical protein
MFETILVIASNIVYLIPAIWILSYDVRNIIYYSINIFLCFMNFIISSLYHICVDNSINACFDKTVNEMYVLDELTSLTIISSFVVLKAPRKYRNLFFCILWLLVSIAVMLGSRFDSVGFGILMFFMVVDFIIIFPFFGTSPLEIISLTLATYLFIAGALVLKYYQDNNYNVYHGLWHLATGVALLIDTGKWIYLQSNEFNKKIAESKVFIRRNSFFRKLRNKDNDYQLLEV